MQMIPKYVSLALTLSQSLNLYIHLPAWFLYLIYSWPLTFNQILDFLQKTLPFQSLPDQCMRPGPCNWSSQQFFLSFSSSLTSNLSSCPVGSIQNTSPKSPPPSSPLLDRAIIIFHLGNFSDFLICCFMLFYS